MHLRSSAALAATVSAAFAQGPGNGISKSTYACSKSAATNAFGWLTKYLPVDEAADDCPGRKCSCGAVSRVALKISGESHANASARRAHGLQGPSPGFGIHCTYAAGKNGARAAANGGTTEEEVEQHMAKVIGDWSTYDTDVNVRSWASYGTGLWAESGLDWYVAQFDKDGVKYHKGSWQSGGSTYWSILVLVPGTPVVLELQGACTACGSAEERRMPAGYVGVPGALPPTTLRAGTAATQGLMYATYVSRAVTDLSALKTYNKQVLGADPVSETTLGDGAKMADYLLSGAQVHIRYIERQGESGAQTTAWFQKLLVDTAHKYQTSYDSCWPIWGDFHFAWDQFSRSILTMVTAAGKLGYPYRAFTGGFGPSNAYVLEPSGMWIQLDGPSQGLPSAPGFSPDYCYTFC